MASPDAYDTIGNGYTNTRRADPRIADSIRRALGDAETVLNVGAGAGAYEPHDRDVVAVASLSRMAELDLGYRIIIAEPTPPRLGLRARRRSSL
jgi:hypothetical protein